MNVREPNRRPWTADPQHQTSAQDLDDVPGPDHHARAQDNTTSSNKASANNHQRFVLADPVAFSYLEEDPSVVILDRARYLEGYQCYVVEQWACSRSHPTFVVIAYTGDSANKIKVGVLSVPADEASWSPRLKVYFRTLARYHARRRDTPLGTVLVTNLSGFPSSLTLISVPDGDVRKHREDFVVNENLKRLGCSGRVGISIAAPTPAAEAKFHQLYRTSEKIELYKSVIELVKLCQAALMLFDELKPEYADGLLCDITEKAVNDWWTDFGYEYFKTEPTDGNLGPSTVAALLGTLIGARNRLHILGAPVSKDVFDIEATKRAINHFQKTHHLYRTRRFDRHTLDNLHRATAKQASTEGWVVPRAVKSTVAELSGKGGEMVMDMVGRERATLAEIETTDMERFAQLVRGERAKWLWQGRARRRTTRDLFDEHPGQMTEKADQDLGVASPSGAQHENAPVLEQKAPRPSFQKHSRTNTAETIDPRKTVLNRVQGRLRGATFGKRGQQHKLPHEAHENGVNNRSYESINSAKTEPLSPVDPTAEVPDNIFDEHTHSSQHNHRSEGSRLRDIGPRLVGRLGSNPVDATPAIDEVADSSQRSLQQPLDLDELDKQASNVVDTEISVAEEVIGETDIDELPTDERRGQKVGALLLRTESYSKFVETSLEKHNTYRWPRHISFSAVEDTISGSQDVCLASDAAFEDDTAGDEQDEPPSSSTEAREVDLTRNAQNTMRKEKIAEARQRAMRDELAVLDRTMASWLLTQVDDIAVLDSTAAQDAEQMQQLYVPRREEQQALAGGTQEVLKEERARLSESVHDLETLGQRVEYEIGGLRSKVEDMENSVGDFEKSVVFVEERVKELVKDHETRGKTGAEVRETKKPDETWTHWLGSIFAGAKDQKDVGSAVSKAMKQTKAKAEEAVQGASYTNPLTEAPTDSELHMQEASAEETAVLR